MHICSNSMVRMYWMSVCPCSCVFGADFEQICIAEIEILCVKSLVFYASIDVRENFVFDNSLTALYKKILFWVKSNLCSSQDKTIEFYSYSEHFFMRKIFYPVQYFTQIVSMLAMFGQFFIYIFSYQATYLRYIWQHVLSTFVIYYMHCASTFPVHLTI